MHKKTLEEIINEFKQHKTTYFDLLKIGDYIIKNVHIIENDKLDDELQFLEMKIAGVVNNTKKIYLSDNKGYYYSIYLEKDETIYANSSLDPEEIIMLEEEEKVDILYELGYDIEEIEIWVLEEAFEFNNKLYSMYGYEIINL